MNIKLFEGESFDFSVEKSVEVEVGRFETTNGIVGS
jgi:hypothetical protein